MEGLWNYMTSANMMPHGMCYLWRPDMLVLHAGSDTLIALAYFSIPLALAQYWRKKQDVSYGWMLKLFAAFILACGATHLVNVWNIWNGDYYFQGLVKLITAGVSVATAIAIWPLIPKLLSIPSPHLLAERNDALREEISRRKGAEDRLRDLYESLEQTVDERTEQLQQAKQALEIKIQESEQVKQRLQSIFESAPNGMMVVDRTGTIVQANSTAHSIFRYSIGELTSRSIETLVPQPLRNRHKDDRTDYARVPNKRMMGDRKDLYGLRCDGSTVPVEVGLNPVDGSETGEVVASVIDVTQRKDYEHRIEQRTHALEQSNRELKEFAFIASHDLREPLRKIVSFSRLLLSDDYGKMTEEGRTYSLYVVNAAERMRELLDSLLSYSRVTSQARVFVDTDLNDTLQVVLSDLQLAMEESQADIDVGELATLTVDPSQIRQLFQNLLSNSLKYQSPERALRVRVFGEAIHADRYRIIVEDNGIGFAPEYSEQIFEVFKRLHSRSDYAGTGMGLAICRKIAERHQGSIRAEAEPGQGARFIVELPRHTTDEVSYEA